jgi:hypothetical protein
MIAVRVVELKTHHFKKDEWVYDDNIYEIDDKYIPNKGDFFIPKNSDIIYEVLAKIIYEGTGVKLYIKQIATINDD